MALTLWAFFLSINKSWEELFAFWSFLYCKEVQVPTDGYISYLSSNDLSSGIDITETWLNLDVNITQHKIRFQKLTVLECIVTNLIWSVIIFMNLFLYCTIRLISYWLAVARVWPESNVLTEFLIIVIIWLICPQ